MLLDGATAYMDVLRDTAILNLRNNNIDVLDEQLRQTRDRFNVGEVTRTDVAQAEARLASARVGRQRRRRQPQDQHGPLSPGDRRRAAQLAPARALDAVLPRTLDTAVAMSQMEHPRVLAALHAVDAAELQIKITEGELYPAPASRAR